jgi:hypothetical protein
MHRAHASTESNPCLTEGSQFWQTDKLITRLRYMRCKNWIPQMHRSRIWKNLTSSLHTQKLAQARTGFKFKSAGHSLSHLTHEKKSLEQFPSILCARKSQKFKKLAGWLAFELQLDFIAAGKKLAPVSLIEHNFAKAGKANCFVILKPSLVQLKLAGKNAHSNGHLHSLFKRYFNNLIVSSSKKKNKLITNDGT